MADLADQIAARIEERLGKPLDAVLAAMVEATKEAAPQNTGALSMSVHKERTSPTEGAIVMRFYGDIVASGIPGATVRGHSGRAVRMAALSQTRAATAARARYAQQVGRTISHPNDFIAQAWASDRVKAALAQFGDMVFQQN